MTVANWEYWSVATMLVSSHGDDAEAVAEERLAAALDDGHAGDIIVWKEIRKKLGEIRAERAARGDTRQ